MLVCILLSANTIHVLERGAQSKLCHALDILVSNEIATIRDQKQPKGLENTDRRHGRRKRQGLTSFLRWKKGEHFPDFRLESHVKQLIGFIEDEHMQF
jgi:hypothetical protein